MLRLNLEKGKVVEAKLIGIDPISKAVVLGIKVLVKISCLNSSCPRKR